MASFIPGKEFVPGVGLQSMGSKGDLSAIPLEKVSSDLKVTKEWVPPSQRQPSEKSHVLQAAPSTPTASRQGYSASGGGGGGDYDHQWGYDEGEDGNGGAYGGYDTASAEVDEDLGLLWGDNSSTLPAPPRRTLQTLGIPDPIRQHFQDLDHATLRQMEPSDERYKEMPNRFHSAFALDDVYAQTKRGTGGSYGYPTAVYKAVDRSDSQVYALRRVDNVCDLICICLLSSLIAEAGA